ELRAERLEHRVVGFLLRLEREPVDQGREHARFELLLHALGLFLGGDAVEAGIGVGDLRAQVDVDLRAILEVIARELQLSTEQHSRTHERERHEGNEDDRDNRREVATNALERLGENEGKLHEVGPTSSSEPAIPRRSAMPTSGASTSICGTGSAASGTGRSAEVTGSTRPSSTSRRSSVAAVNACCAETPRMTSGRSAASAEVSP